VVEAGDARTTIQVIDTLLNALGKMPDNVTVSNGNEPWAG
jgi:hypothetical protein